MPNDLRHIRKPVHSRCYGIEIECLFPYGNRMPRLYNYAGFWYFTVDGSVGPGYSRYGVEMISQPMPYSWLNKEIGKLEKRYSQWEWNDSCGIHVHVTKKSVSHKRMIELLMFLRTLGGGQEFNLFGRYSNLYSSPRNTDRYCSVNLHRHETIEFRMFSSGSAKWAQECLRRTKLMVEYKGKYTYENLCKLFGLRP